MRYLVALVGLVGLGLSLGGSAQAAAPLEVKVGLAAAGGELGGMIVGGGLGLALGAAGCEVSQSFECYLPVLTTPLGGAMGGVGGATAAGALRARSLHLDHRNVRRWTLAAGALGLGVSALGGATGSEALVVGGAVGGAVGMPLAAGFAAGRSGGPVASDERRFDVALSPSFGLHSYGLSLDGRF